MQLQVNGRGWTAVNGLTVDATPTPTPPKGARASNPPEMEIDPEKDKLLMEAFTAAIREATANL